MICISLTIITDVFTKIEIINFFIEKKKIFFDNYYTLSILFTYILNNLFLYKSLIKASDTGYRFLKKST